MITLRCLFKQPFLLPSILLTVSFLVSSFGIAQAQTPGIKTDRAIYPELPMAVVPSAGNKVKDPVFGTEIMRATDQSDCLAPGCGTWYSQWPTFNSDNTRIIIRSGVNGAMIIKAFDPINFTLGPTLRTSPTLPGGVMLEWQGAIWSRTNPDLIYVHVSYYSPSYPATGMKLYTYRPSTNVFTLLKDFAPELAPGKPDYLFEMHIAQDGKDDLFTFMQNRVGEPQNPLYFIVWRRSTDKVLQHISNDSTFDGNAAMPDKSGRWIFFPLNKTQLDLSRHRTLDLETNTWQTTYWTGEDDAPSHGDVGTGTKTGRGNFSGGFNLRSLSNVHSPTILFDNRDANGVLDWTNDQHTSLYADNESWVMLGVHDDPAETGTETGAFENEVMQIAMDGSQRIRRLFHHRSRYNNLSETTGYWAAPKPTISRDGRFIAFTSNWGDSGRYDLFIAKIEPAGSLEIPAPSPTPSPTPVATPTPMPNSTPASGFEVIWFDDKLPANATPATNNESWNWVSSNPYPYSGDVATRSKLTAGLHQQSFTGASETMTVNVGDVLISYVYLDQSNPPSALMLQWKDNEQGWEHRAYWGSNEIVWGEEGTTGRRRMGALPASGGWVRLEVPASLVGLEGKTINGMAFTLYGGSATWDRAGRVTQNPPPGNPTPSPTPTVTPSPSPSPTPIPVPPPTSLLLVSSAFTLASNLAGSSSTAEAQITPLVDKIAEAYSVFLTELGRFNSISQVDSELRASLYFARGAEALTRMSGPSSSVQNRLQVVAYYLSRAKNAMSTASSGAAASQSLVASTLTFHGTPVIGPAQALSSASFVPVLAPGSLGTILGDPNQSPLSTGIAYAVLSSAGEPPYELSGVSVAIGGKAARLISVSPSRIYFSVPAGLSLGDTEVIVTSQEGYVSRGMTTIAALAPGLFTLNGNGMGNAVAVNASTLASGEFSVTTPQNFGGDKQTRLMIFASGLSNGFFNTNIGNDITFGAAIFPNIAESVVVEAHTHDNRIFQLPVEFAGPSGRSYGLDQINVRLTNELRGAGVVDLTLIIAGHRSNMVTIKIL